MNHEVNTIHGVMTVELSRKNIKKIRLRVFPSSIIRLSVPLDTPVEYIDNLLREKTPWIKKQLESFEQTKTIEKEDTIRTGTSTKILGRQLQIKVEKSLRKRIIKDDGKLIVYTTKPKDQANIDTQFNNWWQKNAKIYFHEVLQRLYPIVEKHEIAPPTIKVKKMQTLWGSCSRKNHIINLNYYLYKAPIPCIEYVIFHELIHFLHPRHDKDFYAMMTIYMPDWLERKKILDYEIVLEM